MPSTSLFTTSSLSSSSSATCFWASSRRRSKQPSALRWRGTHGQVLVLLPLIVLVVLGALAVVARFGAAVAERQRAQQVADAAALSVALDGRAPPAEDASTHVVGGRGDAEVEVRIGAQRASARAVAEQTHTTRRAGLAPSMVAALARAEEMLGYELTIVSGFRSHEHQQRLWDQRDSNPYPVAVPGTSLHERGLAVDVPRWQVDALLSVASRAGLCHPLPVTDPVHFVACPIPE